jgi:hypothetical protein
VEKMKETTLETGVFSPSLFHSVCEKEKLRS